MKRRILFRIVFGLLILFAVVVGLISINHPIILKWLSGSARHLGTPISATIVTNGRVNDDIKIFYTDEPDIYLLSLAEFDISGRLKYLNINLNENWIGFPSGTSKRDYDFIAGHLFQSETGSRFTPFQDDIKGLNFDPQLLFTGEQIKFNVPPGTLDFDSVLIELP